MSDCDKDVSKDTAYACAQWLDSLGVLVDELHTHINQKTLEARELANALRSIHASNCPPSDDIQARKLSDGNAFDAHKRCFVSSSVVNDQSLNDEKSIEEHRWYSDCNKGEAVSILERLQSSETVFLVRPASDGGYALSVKYNSKIAHIHIHSKENTKLAASKTRIFYVSDAREFPSIQKLVAHYMENSLKESFPMWPTKLSVPFRDLIPAPIGQAIATADYKCTNSKLEIELKKDCKYWILTRDVIQCRVYNKIGLVGYAPAKYLNEIPSD